MRFQLNLCYSFPAAKTVSKAKTQNQSYFWTPPSFQGIFFQNTTYLCKPWGCITR